MPRYDLLRHMARGFTDDLEVPHYRVDRNFETALIRLVFEWSPQLSDYPVAIDAREERLFLQGGDVIVADGSTLFIGVGNLTEEVAARRLARALEMDVIAVQLPTGDDRAGVEMYKS
ncbi:MAG: hypothetical protein H0X65_10605 [Gemmatimonadetes bacterium]|nr:hypothetical protein [Gemmatimonadota bacterium]